MTLGNCDGCKHQGKSYEDQPCEWCARNPELGEFIDEYEELQNR